VENTINYKTCNQTTQYLNQEKLDLYSMCTVDSCKAVLADIASYSTCIMSGGSTNKAFACSNITASNSSKHEPVSHSVDTTLTNPYLAPFIQTISDKDSGNSNLGIYVGVGCGIALLLGIVTACFIIKFKRSKKDQNAYIGSPQ